VVRVTSITTTTTTTTNTINRLIANNLVTAQVASRSGMLPEIILPNISVFSI
jgi:hypothetical protein